jgi:hypothetical protein
VVVGKLVLDTFRRARPHDATFDLDLLDGRLDEARVTEARTDRLRAMAELQDAGAGLEEERAQQKKIVAANERNLYI